MRSDLFQFGRRVLGLLLAPYGRPTSPDPKGAILYTSPNTRRVRALCPDGTDVALSGTSGGGGAPTTAQYVTLATDATLTAERVLTGTANRVTVTDNGAGSTVVLDVGSNVYVAGGTDVAVADGGTGASTAAGARTNLGLGTIAVENVAASGDLAGSWPSPTVTQARGLRETAGPTTLTMGAVADGQLLKRSGSTIIGVYIVLAHLLPAQSGPYNVLTPTGQHATFTGSTWV